MRFDPVLFGARLFRTSRVGFVFNSARLYAMLFGNYAVLIARMLCAIRAASFCIVALET
jgi:hypothetical protein